MAKKWVIVEDSHDKAADLIEAIKKSRQAEELIACIFANPDLHWKDEESELSEFTDDKSIAIFQCQNAGDIEEVLEGEILLADDLIVFLDVHLNEICSIWDLESEAYPLTKKWQSIAQDTSRRNIICIYSRDYRSDRAARFLGQGKSTVFASTKELGGNHPVESALEIVEEALKQYDFLESPIERLWDQSLRDREVWFSQEDSSVPHTLNQSQIYDFLRENPCWVSQYKQNLEKGFGFKLPETWFFLKGKGITEVDTESVAILHENLKCLCGCDYLGLERAGIRSLSVGSVFLIAMMAYNHTHRRIGLFEEAVSSWAELSKSNSSFLVLQSADRAKNTALSIFKFFELIFKTEKKDKDNRGNPSLLSCESEDNGRVFVFNFSWAGKNLADKLDQSLQLQKSDRKETPKNDALYLPFPSGSYNVTSSLRWLLYHILFQQEGFLHPGHLYMQKDALYVGSILNSESEKA